MRRVRIMPVAAALAIGVTVAFAACGEDGDTADEVQQATSETPEETGEAREATGAAGKRERPKPDARFELACDYDLQGLNSGFIAAGRVLNTGNVGIVAEVRVSWERLGAAPPITNEEVVEVPTGESRRIRIDIPAADDDIERLLRADSKCKAKGKVIDSFGDPPVK